VIFRFSVFFTLICVFFVIINTGRQSGRRDTEMKFRQLFLLLMVVTLIVCFSGCGGSTAGGTYGLENTAWTLKSYGAAENPQPLVEDTEITANFNPAESRVHGSAGCNNYFGGYKIDKGLSISMLASTEMYCMEPEGVMDQETGYLRILESAEDYAI
jgi:heat shock protein HslJ